MPRDSRPWLRVSVDMWRHPKITALPPSRRWALIGLWSLAMEYRTDGFLDTQFVRKNGITSAAIVALKDAGLLSISDDNRVIELHDFLEHQSSAADLDRMTQQRRSAGKKGGLAKASNREAQASGSLTDSLSKPPRDTRASVEVEEEPTYVGSAALRTERASAPPHEASTHFADGTPIPGESAAVVPLRRDRGPAPSSAANALAAMHCPPGTPGMQIRALAAVVQELIDDDAVERVDLEAALTAWRQRSDAGPRLLPSLVTDAAKARAGGKPGAATARPEAKQRTYANLVQKLETQAAQHKEIEA